MDEVKKSFIATLIISSILMGVKFMIQRKEEAEFSKYCQQLKSIRAEVLNRIESGREVSNIERQGAYMAGRTARLENCPE